MLFFCSPASPWDEVPFRSFHPQIHPTRLVKPLSLSFHECGWKAIPLSYSSRGESTMHPTLSPFHSTEHVAFHQQTRNPLKLVVIELIHRHRPNVLLRLEIVHGSAIIVVLNLPLTSRPNQNPLELLLGAHMRHLHADALLHALPVAISHALQHRHDRIIVVRNELLAQRSDGAGVYQSPHGTWTTRVVERDRFAHGLQQVVEEEASPDEALARTTRLELEQARDVHTVLALGVHRPRVEVEVLDGAETIQAHAHNAREVYVAPNALALQFMMSVSTSLFLSTRMCAISEPLFRTISSHAFRMWGLYLG